MTTINSLDDFLLALDSNPSWREAIRARILGEELLQLPARFNALVERMDSFIEEQKQFREELNRLSEEQKQFREELNRLSEEQKQFREELNLFREELRRLGEELRRLDDRMENHMTLTDDILSRIESDISVVKGGHAQARVAAFTEVIAANLGLDFVRALTPMQLHHIAKNITDPTANADQRESFINADLVIEGSDSDGHAVYIAVETSWTADRRDSGRALRNARYLTNSTGRPAIAAIASVRNDHEVTEQISCGGLRWHRIPDRELEPA